MQGVIAEIGNFHMGDIHNAKYLIKTAVECGADYVKLQAIDPDTFKGGSMPESFYRECSFSLDEYKSLVDYGNEIGTNVFYSVFGDKYKELYTYCNFMKISASQSTLFTDYQLHKYNHSNTAISIQYLDFINRPIDKMNVMIATPYNSECGIRFLKWFKENFESGIGNSGMLGISDHSSNFDHFLKIITTIKFPLVEKHFYLGNDLIYDGVLYRDCKHAVDPEQLRKIAKIMNQG